MTLTPATWLRRLLGTDDPPSRAERAKQDAQRWLRWREEQFSRRLEQHEQDDDRAPEQA